LKANIAKDSIKTEKAIEEGGLAKLKIGFKLDAIVRGVVRINTCVTQ